MSAYEGITVAVTSAFWRHYRDLVADEVLPYMWAVMDDSLSIQVPGDPSGNTFEQSASHVIRNLRITAGELTGHHYGYPFQDSDAYKWLEAAAYVLEYRDDQALRDKAEALVDLLARAQDPDGYLVSLFQIDLPDQKFKHLRFSHELYTMGHGIEGLVAYYQSTGSQQALSVARKMADCIDTHFGPEPGKIHGVDGHPEIEVALPRLYEVTGERRYLDLARYFLTERGRDPAFFDRQDQAGSRTGNDLLDSTWRPDLSYFVADRPVSQLTRAEGHAVRVVYLCTALARVGRLTGDPKLLAVARRLWTDITRRRMYITGQIGSTAVGEAFTYDYDLPDDTMYGESCASVGLSFFANRMMQAEPSGDYGDVLERELFNGALSGMALDGKHFFYVNPLEADPAASRGNPGKRHVLTRRAEWFGCACCPSNIARLIASVDRYLYTTGRVDTGQAAGITGTADSATAEAADSAVTDPSAADPSAADSPVATDLAAGAADSPTASRPVIYSHQFIANRASFSGDLAGVEIIQENDFPHSGHIVYRVNNPQRVVFRLAIRIPAWSRQFSLSLDGQAWSGQLSDGFAVLPIDQASTQISLELDMRPQLMRASTRIRADIGQLALMRGPQVYCAEGVDNQEPLWLYSLPADTSVEALPELAGLPGVVPLRLRAEQAVETVDGALPYGPAVTEPAAVDTASATAVTDAIGAAPVAADSLDAVASPLPVSPVASVPAWLTLVPYYAWANRAEGQMAVWWRASASR